MSLAWHIARKDLFRLRVILLLWAVVLTARMAFALIQAHADADAAMGFIAQRWMRRPGQFYAMLTLMLAGTLCDLSIPWAAGGLIEAVSRPARFRS